MIWRSEIHLWFVFCEKTYSKRLKFNEVDIYKFKIKKQSTRLRKKVTPKLAIKATK